MSSTAPRLQDARVYRTYFETLGIPGTQRLSAWVALGLLAVAISGVGFWFLHKTALLATFLILGACIAIVPVTMKGIYTILVAWTATAASFLKQDQLPISEWQGWFRQQFEIYSSSRAILYFALIYTTFAVPAFWLGGAFDEIPIPMALVCAVIAGLASFVCGVGLASIFYLARFIWQVGCQYSVRVSAHSYGVLSTGRMLVRCYALVAIVWCLYTSSGTFYLSGRSVPLLALAAPAILFFLGSFVLCQFPLRKRMVECKRAALLELDDLLERLTPKEPEEITDERERQIHFCLSEMKRVREWPEWPFSLGNLSEVTGASLGAVAPQLFHIVLPLLMKKPPWHA